MTTRCLRSAFAFTRLLGCALAAAALCAQEEAPPPAIGSGAVGTASSAASEFVTREVDGLTYRFLPEDEPVARELAAQLAASARDAGAVSDARNETAAAAPPPLSVADLRANRADYLRRVAACIGLEEPTSLQEECYDGFLENFEATEKLVAFFGEKMVQAAAFHTVTIYRKSDLLRRLKAGEAISGMVLNEDGESGSFNLNFETHGHNPELKDLFRQRDARRLDIGYSISTKEGVADLSGYFRLGRDRPAAKPAESPAAARDAAEPTSMGDLPLIFDDDNKAGSPREIAARLAKFVTDFRKLPQTLRAVRQDPASLAYLILHETAEIGIVERYLGSRDRRWLCDGVANYVAWKVARDRAGANLARSVYDLDAQLAQWAGARDKIDLRKWTAAERQSAAEKEAPLNKAHYPFATRAVFLMVERHGEEVVPGLFREVGRTPRKKATMRTVEKAYRKLTREELSHVLAAAVAPVPAAAAAASVAQTPSSP